MGAPIICADAAAEVAPISTAPASKPSLSIVHVPLLAQPQMDARINR
jgi:hypothetical protein